MDCLEFLRVKVERKHLLLLDKDDLVWVTVSVNILEVILHAHLVEVRDVLDYDSFDEFELIVGVLTSGSLSFEDKKLVLLLLILDKVLTTDDSQVVLALILLHTDDLIWLPCLCL